MALYEFKDNDVIRNVVIAHPKISFKIFKTKIFYNNIKLSTDVKDGYVHIYDYNLQSS